ncbi:MAG: hypothetical protein Q4P29_05350 [Tissierellia bacterium]|nr:hypothetical protein [Tissierellia bacterium]
MQFEKIRIDNDDYLEINLDTENIIRINNNENLKAVLKKYGNKILARKALDAYYKRYDRSLDITANSVAIEISGHAIPDDIAKQLEQKNLPSILKEALEKIIKHTDIIDIGTKDVDKNRWFWDAIAKLM